MLMVAVSPHPVHHCDAPYAQPEDAITALTSIETTIASKFNSGHIERYGRRVCWLCGACEGCQELQSCSDLIFCLEAEVAEIVAAPVCAPSLLESHGLQCFHHKCENENIMYNMFAPVLLSQHFCIDCLMTGSPCIWKSTTVLEDGPAFLRTESRTGLCFFLGLIPELGTNLSAESCDNIEIENPFPRGTV